MLVFRRGQTIAFNADYRAAHRVIVDAAAQAQRVTDYFRSRRLAS